MTNTSEHKTVKAGTTSAPASVKSLNDDSKNNPETVMKAKLGEVAGGVSYDYDYSKMKDVDYFIEFTAYKYLRGRQGNAPRTKHAIFRLPLMSGINTNYSMNYSNADISLFIDALFSTAKAGMNLYNGANASANLEAAFAQTTGALTQQGISAITNGGVYGAAAANEVGIANNPRTEATFVGIGMRSHAFAFSLIPRNQEENDMINRIIRAVKLLQHPDVFVSDIAAGLSNAFLNFPVEWTISFYSSQTGILNIPTIPDCFLQSFGVSYNGNGSPIFFSDGSATSYRIDMGFVEGNQLTKTDIETGNY